MKKLVVATKNRGKLIEIAELLVDHDVKLYSLHDFPKMPDIVEDGETFEENAIRKAMAAFEWTKLPAIADDSGLEVDALNGAPGVHSARYGGNSATDEEKIDKLLAAMIDLPLEERTARFRCAMAFVDSEGEVFVTEGTCEGVIAFECRGSGGFGYDPIFMLREYGKTFAELGSDIKNRISHRAVALQKMREILQERL
ncbi:MAG: XTP/dITP diphosphatase [Bacillota bacterium]|jgi:XTP/dITP diphosphohydrolase|nr:XTP/dITP diphosphatase [Bacillota bacterium]HOB90820.1 XTP/dITP diphosphatase [Bacillota bacterium]HPZ53999.1 XTP/dITP diphosphatase [Bacillota bacterium]HQD17470.1 XTP/dITP diphosphatase [Bacillota bacterium]